MFKMEEVMGFFYLCYFFADLGEVFIDGWFGKWFVINYSDGNYDFICY